ncbi:hypothetical protein ABZ693_25755, partial [Streptomyces laurentii]
ALATSIPLLIGFLASLLGIGNLANKVKSVFHTVSKPVNRAIDKLVDLIAKKGKALWRKFKGKAPSKEFDSKGDEKRESRKRRELPQAIMRAREIVGEAERERKTPKSLLVELKNLRGKFGWIRNFRLEGSKPAVVILIASRHQVSEFNNLPSAQQLQQVTAVRQMAHASVDSLKEVYQGGRVSRALERSPAVRDQIKVRYSSICVVVDGRKTWEREYRRAIEGNPTRKSLIEIGRKYLDCHEDALKLTEELENLKATTPPRVGDLVDVRWGENSWVPSKVTGVTGGAFEYRALSDYGKSHAGVYPLSQPWREFDPNRHYKKGSGWDRIKNKDSWNNYPDARQTLNYRHHESFQNPFEMEWHHIHEQSANGPNSVDNLTLSHRSQNAAFNHWFNRPQNGTNGVKLREYLKGIGATPDQHREWGDVCLEKHGLKVESVDRGRGRYQILVPK